MTNGYNPLDSLAGRHRALYQSVERWCARRARSRPGWIQRLKRVQVEAASKMRCGIDRLSLSLSGCITIYLQLPHSRCLFCVGSQRFAQLVRPLGHEFFLILRSVEQ